MTSKNETLELEALKEQVLGEALEVQKTIPVVKLPVGRPPVNVATGLTENEERFAMAFAKTQNLEESYKAAGYIVREHWMRGMTRLKARKIWKRPRVQKRIAELNEVAAIKCDMTRDLFHQKLLEHREIALQNGDVKAANQAMQLLGQSLSYLVEKKATIGVNATLNGDDPADKKARVMAMMKQLGFGGTT
jgi:hypothetical protein